jgi:hypothetical protein
MTRKPSRPPLAEAFGRANWSLEDLPIHRDALARDSAELLGALDRVRSYRAFLARARAAKSDGRAVDIDREVLAGARVAQADAAVAAASGARVMRALHVGGAFTRLSGAMAESLRGSGPVKADDLWTQVRTDACRPCLEKYRVSDDMLDEFGDVLARTDLTIASDGAGVLVEGLIDGQRVRARMAVRAPAAGLPRDPIELLTAGRFVALCDALECAEPAYLLGTGPRREPPSLEDLLMRDALAGQRESIRHVRKLEDVGLATYSGGDPATVVAILLVVAIIGAIIVAVECDEEDQEPGGEPSTACMVGTLMLMLGTLVIIGMAFHDKQQQLNTLGQNISGPLPQLQGEGA